eukprot:1160665-Pelagomonas_calceolata.AAC.6
MSEGASQCKAGTRQRNGSTHTCTSRIAKGLVPKQCDCGGGDDGGPHARTQPPATFHESKQSHSWDLKRNKTRKGRMLPARIKDSFFN